MVEFTSWNLEQHLPLEYIEFVDVCGCLRSFKHPIWEPEHVARPFRYVHSSGPPEALQGWVSWHH